MILKDLYCNTRKSDNKKSENKDGLKVQKSNLLYHNSYDFFHNVVSLVNEPPYDKLMSQYMHQALVWISLSIYPK